MFKANRKERYFAFGSNLLIEQMAERCPASLLEGTAILRDYRWIINTRGVANIVYHPGRGHWVEGFVFLVDSKDERTLDRKEGVRLNLYQKFSCQIELRRAVEGPLKINHLARLMRDRDDDYAQQRRKRRLLDLADSSEKVDALVYISPNLKSGRIREEYAIRMSRALRDAFYLGLSGLYLANYLQPTIRGLLVPTEQSYQQERNPQPHRVAAFPSNVRRQGEEGIDVAEPDREHFGRRSSEPLGRPGPLRAEARCRRRSSDPELRDERWQPERHRDPFAAVQEGFGNAYTKHRAPQPHGFLYSVKQSFRGVSQNTF